MFRDRFTIGTKLYAGCASLLALITLTGAVAMFGASNIKGDLTVVTARAEQLRHALTIQNSLLRIESQEKTMLWAGLDSDKALYESAKAAIAAEYEKANKSVQELSAAGEGKEEATIAASLAQTLADSKTIHTQIVELNDVAQYAAAQELLDSKGQPLLKTAEEAAGRMVASQQQEMNQAGEDASSSYWTALVLVGIVLVIAVGVSGIGVLVVRRINSSLLDVSRELRDGAQLVVDASSQMAVSAQSMSQGASQQAASLEETSASMEELAGMTRRNAESSHEATTVMVEAADVVQGSDAALSDMVTSMASIRDSSNRVSKIIKTIDEIAFQTNILALNAAVEAARAGEAGMGFAVVADEVRSLAQRSAQAAKDTANLIEEAIASSNQGSGKVEQVAAAFSAITASVTKIKGLVEDVSTASKRGALGIEQVLQAVRQMERVTQTSAATAEESAAACEQLNAQADITIGVVRRLEVMVGASRFSPKSREGAHAGRGHAAIMPGDPLRPMGQSLPGNSSALTDSGSYGPF